MDGQPFFILWNPDSELPPTVPFRSLKVAQAAAERMAREHGGTFFVCRAVASAQREEAPVSFKRIGPFTGKQQVRHG